MSDDKKKSPLVEGQKSPSKTESSSSGLPTKSDPTTSPILKGDDLKQPAQPNPTSLGEVPSPTERTLRTEEKLSDSYGRPIGSADVSSGAYGSGSSGAQFSAQSQSNAQPGQDTSEQAKQKAQDAKREAEQRTQQARREAEQRAKQAKRGFTKLMNEQPLVVGLVAALIGILVGIAFPTTRREDELMGEVSDSTIERAKEVAQRTFETAKETVKEEARNQGLTPESLKQEAQDKLQAAQDVAKKAAEEAQRTAQEEAKKKS